MTLEVVPQLARSHQQREEELLRHGVPCPRIPQHRANEVHRVLDEGRRAGEARVLRRLGCLLRWWDPWCLIARGNLYGVVLLSLVFCCCRFGSCCTLLTLCHLGWRCSLVWRAPGLMLLSDRQRTLAEYGVAAR